MSLKKFKLVSTLLMGVGLAYYSGEKLVLSASAAQQEDVQAQNQTFLWRCSYIQAREAAALVRDFWEEQSKNPNATLTKATITSDDRTNTILVTGTPEKIDQAKTVIKKIDMGTVPIQLIFPRKSPKTLAEVATELKIARSSEKDLGKNVAIFLRLTQTDPTNQEAYLRQPLFEDNKDQRVKSNDKNLNTFPIISEKGKPVLTAHVLRIDQRDLYIQVKDFVYVVYMGKTVSEGLEHPLSDAALKSLDLVNLIKPFVPKKDQAAAAKENRELESRLKEMKDKGQEYFRIMVAESRIHVEMLVALDLRMREFDKVQAQFKQGAVPEATVVSAIYAVEKARKQLEQFEGY